MASSRLNIFSVHKKTHDKQRKHPLQLSKFANKDKPLMAPLVQSKDMKIFKNIHNLQIQVVNTGC